MVAKQVVKAVARLSPRLVPAVHLRAASAPGFVSIDADMVVGDAGGGGENLKLDKLTAVMLNVSKGCTRLTNDGLVPRAFRKYTTCIVPATFEGFVAIIKNLQYNFPKTRGGSKAIWNFSEKTSVFVASFVP